MSFLLQKKSIVTRKKLLHTGKFSAGRCTLTDTVIAPSCLSPQTQKEATRQRRRNQPLVKKNPFSRNRSPCSSSGVTSAKAQTYSGTDHLRGPAEVTIARSGKALVQHRYDQGDQTYSSDLFDSVSPSAY